MAHQFESSASIGSREESVSFSLFLPLFLSISSVRLKGFQSASKIRKVVGKRVRADQVLYSRCASVETNKRQLRDQAALGLASSWDLLYASAPSLSTLRSLSLFSLLMSSYFGGNFVSAAAGSTHNSIGPLTSSIECKFARERDREWRLKRGEKTCQGATLGGILSANWVC